MVNHADIKAQQDDLLRRFTIVTGKGGVGKSTVVALLALLSTQRGLRTLVIELNSDGNAARFLGHEPSDGEVKSLENDLWTVNIRPPKALQEYGMMKLKFRTFYKLVFDNPLVRSLVQFIPGMNDLLMLGKAFNHERETDALGHPQWDTIIIDAPATGHGLTFFKFPKVIRDVVPAGNMHRETDEMWKLLIDRDRTQIHLVSIPEELPVQETIELHDALAHELGLPIGQIFLNRSPENPFSAAAGTSFLECPVPTPNDPLRAIWDISLGHLKRSHRAQAHRSALAKLTRPIIELPEIYSNQIGRADLEDFLVGLNEKEAIR